MDSGREQRTPRGHPVGLAICKLEAQARLSRWVHESYAITDWESRKFPLALLRHHRND
jgi:hypothetical protein